jgi:hypothetical protein
MNRNPNCCTLQLKSQPAHTPARPQRSGTGLAMRGIAGDPTVAYGADDPACERSGADPHPRLGFPFGPVESSRRVVPVRTRARFADHSQARLSAPVGIREEIPGSLADIVGTVPLQPGDLVGLPIGGHAFGRAWRNARCRGGGGRALR